MRLDRMLLPRTVAVLGSATADGRRLLANLAAGGFAGAIWTAEDAAGVAGLPGVPDVALVASRTEALAGDLAALRARGGSAAIVTGALIEPIPAGLRVLGPRAFGLAVPRLGLNASLSHMAVPPGHVALVTQSGALARTVVDWAGPNGVGFSHVVGVGATIDVCIGEVLDFLSRDTHTRLILLDVRRVRNRRAFISAARAASRLRPVVALRPGGRLLDASGQADAVFAAALRRAGVFVVDRLEGFLSAAETLSRARPLRGETMAVITNAIGPGRLAADAALRAGIALAVLPADAQQTLVASLPADLTFGLIYAGSAAPTDVASIAAMVSAVPQVGGVLVLLAPTGPDDAAAVQSVIAAAHTASLPVLTCVMGETTGAAHRRCLAAAGLPAFATPEQAVQGFSHLLRDRAAREAARELPPSRVLSVDADRGAAALILAGARAAGRLCLGAREAALLLAAYGIDAAGTGTFALRLEDDAVFGPAISITISIAMALPGAAAACDLPPLNLPLAEALARRAGLADPAALAACADVLVRVSQLQVDHPEIAAIELGAPSAHVRLHPIGMRAELAISPYPAQLARHWHGGGQDFLIRPIRPEDAAAHAALVARVPPEDLRFRFFSAMREVAAEQMARLTQIDYDREMAFVAVRQPDQASVGVARLVCEAPGLPGEFAMLIEPASKGFGLASHLMARLIEWARAQDVPAITGQVLADNRPMLGFVRRMGFELRHLPGDAEVIEAVLRIA